MDEQSIILSSKFVRQVSSLKKLDVRNGTNGFDSGLQV